MLASGCNVLSPSDTNTNVGLTKKTAKTLTVKNQTLNLELANTDELRTLGLSYRESLPENTGMLFDFTNTGITKPAFWMKGMKFNIDIIWILDKKIIGITKNVPASNLPDKELPTYPPPSEIGHVLEVNAGWSDKHNIAIGDQINF